LKKNGKQEICELTKTDLAIAIAKAGVDLCAWGVAAEKSLEFSEHRQIKIGRHIIQNHS